MAKISITYGAVHPDLEQKLLQVISDTKATNPLAPLLIVVGSRLASQYLRQTLLNHFGSFANIHIQTLTRFAINVHQFVNLANEYQFPPAGSNTIATLNTLDEIRDSPKLRVLSDKTGLFRMLEGIYTELYENGFDKFPSGVLEEAEFETALTRGFQSFHNEVSQNTSPFQTKLTPEEAQTAVKRLFGTEEIFFYGIYDYTFHQRNFVFQFTPTVKLNFFLPGTKVDDNTKSAFDYVKHFTDRLRENFPTDIEETFLAPPDGNRLSAVLFKPQITESKLSIDAIDFSASIGTIAEIKHCVKKIHQLLVYKDVKPHQIGIVLWDAENYLYFLTKELQRADISFSNTIGEKLADCSIAQWLIEALELDVDAIKRESLAHFISLSEVVDKVTYPNVDVAHWIGITEHLGTISDTPDGWIRRLDKLLSPEQQQTDTQIESLRNYLNDTFSRLQTLKKSTSIQAKCAILTDWLEADFQFGTDKTALLRVIDEISSLNFTQDIKHAEFLHLLTRAQNSKKHNKDSYVLSRVIITDKMGARNIGWQHLFVLGCSSDHIPVHRSFNPILSNNVRMKVNHKAQLNSPRLPLQFYSIEEERLLFAMLMDSAAKKVYLSFSKWDEVKGVSKLPSQFLLELYKALYHKNINSEEFVEHIKPPIEQPDWQEKEFTKREFVIGWLKNNADIRSNKSLLNKCLKEIYPQFAIYGEVKHKRAFELGFTEYDGIINLNVIPSNEFKLSASSIENWKDCAYRYYVNNVLRISRSELPEDVFEVPGNITGTIIHTFLARLYLELSRNVNKSDFSKFTSDAWINGEILKLTRDQSNKFTAPDSTWLFTNLNLRNRLKKLTRFVILRQDDWKMLHAEYPISHIYKLDDDILAIFTGRTDRIDKNGNNDGIKLIDYKTGSKEIKAKGLQEGGFIQFPLYFDVLRKRKELVFKAEESSAELWHIKSNGDCSILSINFSDLSEQFENSILSINSMSQSLKRGLFPPAKASEKSCDYCDVKTCCDIDSRKKLLSDWNHELKSLFGAEVESEDS